MTIESSNTMYDGIRKNIRAFIWKNYGLKINAIAEHEKYLYDALDSALDEVVRILANAPSV